MKLAAEGKLHYILDGHFKTVSAVVSVQARNLSHSSPASTRKRSLPLLCHITTEERFFLLQLLSFNLYCNTHIKFFDAIDEK